MSDEVQPRRMAAWLGAWLVLSIAAVIVVFTVQRPDGHAAAAPTAVASRTVPAAAPRTTPPPLGSVTTVGGGLTVEGSRDWQVRTFIVVHQTFYYGTRQMSVRGCPKASCTARPVDLGRYQREFVEAVKAQGSGLICAGPYTNKYLTWDSRNGFRITAAPHVFGSDAALRPFRSVFSTSPLLPVGTRFRVLACGTVSRAVPVSAGRRTCAALQRRTLQVTATSEVPAGRTIWIYAGRQESEHFAPGDFDRVVLRIG